MVRSLGIGAALCAVCACGAARPSFDDAPRVTTSVHVSDSARCRVEDMLRDSLADGLGSVSFASGADSMLQVEVRLIDAAPGWRGRIEVRSHDGSSLGQRTLDLVAGSCDDARSSLAFVLAMLVETPAIAQAVEDAEATPEVRGRVTRLGVIGGMSLGRTPFVAGYVGLSTAVSWPNFDLRVEARALLPGEEGVPRFRAFGAELALLGCPSVRLGLAGALGVCAGIRAGVLHSEGVELTPNIAATGGLADATLSLRPVLRFSRFSFGLDLGGGVALIRPEFAYQRGEEVVGIFEPARLWGEFGVFASFSL